MPQKAEGVQSISKFDWYLRVVNCSKGCRQNVEKPRKGVANQKRLRNTALIYEKRANAVHGPRLRNQTSYLIPKYKPGFNGQKGLTLCFDWLILQVEGIDHDVRTTSKGEYWRLLVPGKVSISSKFYEQLFCIKVQCADFLCSYSFQWDDFTCKQILVLFA